MNNYDKLKNNDKFNNDVFENDNNLENDDKLELKATLDIESNEELYKVVDFLNKNLKDRKVIFGLSKKGDKMQISIYET